MPDTIDIATQFRIDSTQTVPLWMQLQEQLESFISRSAPGTLLPTELELQEALGISRITVRNAMLPLYHKGYIVRNHRQGTRVAKRPTQAAIHQLALGTQDMPQTSQTTLTLVLFENIPFQREFWEYAVDDFNGAYPDYRILIQWLPQTVTAQTYSTYLNETKPDLYQYSANMTGETFARPLSQQLQRLLASKDFCTCSKLKPERFSYAYSCPMIFWNKDLAETCGIQNIASQIKAGKYVEVLKDALPKLPLNCRLSGHIWDTFCFAYQSIMPNQLKKEPLEALLQTVSFFHGQTQAFYTRQTDSFDSVRNFASGNQLFLDVYSAAWNVYRRDAAFTVNCIPFMVPEQHYLNLTPHYLVVSKTSQHERIGELFLEHMLSEPIQRQLILKRLILPRRQSALIYGASQRFNMTAAETKKLISKFNLFQACYDNLALFLVHSIRNDLADLLENNAKSNWVLEQILLKWDLAKTIKSHSSNE